MLDPRTLLAVVVSTTLVACTREGSSDPPRADGPAGQAVTVEVRPARVSLLPGETFEFTSHVTGTADPSVTWEVAEVDGGTVTGTGAYAAPLATGEYTVRALSKASPGSSGSAKVRVGRIAVAVTPASATVPAGGTLAFTARVRGTKDDAVAWSVREPSGCGSVDASGLYTAPPAAATCHVVATSLLDPAAMAETVATVTAAPAAPTPVVVTIAPATAAVDACGTLQLTATVSGASDGAITWAVREGSAGGTVTPAGVYTAPAAAGTYHVVATSQAATASSASAEITVAERILAVEVSPATITVAPGGSAQLTATVTSTCGSFTATKTITAPN